MKRPVFTLSIFGSAVATALLTIGALSQVATTVNAQKAPTPGCQNLPSESQLKQLLVQAQNVNKPIGGLFNGERMWGAIVNRDGACQYETRSAGLFDSRKLGQRWQRSLCTESIAISQPLSTLSRDPPISLDHRSIYAGEFTFNPNLTVIKHFFFPDRHGAF